MMKKYSLTLDSDQLKLLQDALSVIIKSLAIKSMLNADKEENILAKKYVELREYVLQKLVAKEDD